MSATEDDSKSDEARGLASSPESEPQPVIADEELDDVVIRRGFQLLLSLALGVLILAFGLLIFRLVDAEESPQGDASFGQVKESISVQVQRAKKFPRIDRHRGMTIEVLQPHSGAEPVIGNSETRRFSGGLSITSGPSRSTELLSVSPWPDGHLRRWKLTSNGLVELELGIGPPGTRRGWISFASIDVNGDGLQDIVTGGLGEMGCWLQSSSGEHYEWQTDACGLTVDGDTWVSSIEALDVNGDGEGDLWLNLMTKREESWLGKPNALWISAGGKFRQGTNFLKSTRPSRASFASSVFDLDRDGVSEILVSNLDGPMEIWRQISGHPFVESRQFFGIGPSPQTDHALLVGELEGDPVLVYSESGKPIAYAFPKRATGTSISHLFEVLASQAPNAERWTWWDYDLDGRKDLLAGTFGCLRKSDDKDCSTRTLLRNEQMPTGLLHPQSTPKFEKAQEFGLYLKWDLDADGDDDFIVMHSNGSLDLQFNQTDLGHHWLGLSFAARWAGADVTIETSDGGVHREVIQSSNGSRVNQGLWRRIGLKDAFYVTRIRLSHPSAGNIQLNKPQPIDTWLHFD
jgi:hypothetical protein